MRSWRSRRWKRRLEVKRGVKQSTCGGEAGWYQEEEGGIRRTCESELSKLHDESEKVNGTLPRKTHSSAWRLQQGDITNKELRV